MDSGTKADSAPREIGPYRIERLLGEGGMGRVYLAHQQTPIRRTVALKLIKHGISSKATLARFEAERQSLELMDHPSIARVLDAGSTDDGCPYFVMEYVDGVPITQFCDEHRLATDQRLRLLIQVCEAVQHAHVKGVIHRDIKPSNVLVISTERGPRSKVIDFGIAKATGERMLEWTHFTEMGRLIGTPEYMSPEQADTSRRDVDTRTDVYALGVLLYELLVGRTPHDAKSMRKAGLEEMLRQIREVDHPTPSSRLSTLGEAATAIATDRSTDPGRLLRQVRGELDWITMRALEKDRERRYGSARELAEDLWRHLAHEPVQARAPSPAYRLRKFVRRHRLGVGIGAAALLTLVLFAGSMAWQARLIARERDRARTEAETSQRVSGLLVDLFSSSDPYGMQRHDVTAREILDRGSGRVQQALSDEPTVLARMLATMGWAYHGLGERQRASEMMEQALALYEKEVGHDNPKTIEATFGLAVIRENQMRYDEAEALYRQTVEQRSETLGPRHRKTLRSRMELPQMWIDLGRYEDARRELEDLHAIHLQTFGPDDPDTLSSGVLLAITLSHSGDSEAAAPLVDAGVAKLRLPPDAYEEDRSLILMRLAWTCTFMGRYSEAESVYRHILEHRKHFLGAEHPHTLQVHEMLANVYAQQGRWDEVIPIYDTLLENRKRVLGDDHPSTLFTKTIFGANLIDAGRPAASEAMLVDAIEQYERIGLEDFGWLRARTILANVFRLSDRPREALEAHIDIQEPCDRSLGKSHPICRSNLAGTAECLRTLGEVQRAEEIEARLEALQKSARVQ